MPESSWAQMRVSGAWARATAPGQAEGAVYLSLTSQVPDKLVGVASPDAGMAMLHLATRRGGIAGMEDVDAVDLPAGKTVMLAPRGTHVMLMELHHGLPAGGTVALDLSFAHAPAIHLVAPVLPIGAKGPSS